MDFGTKVASLAEKAEVPVVELGLVTVEVEVSAAAASFADLDMGIQQHRRCFAPGIAGKGRAP